MLASGWVQVTAPSPMAYERYDVPARSAREPTLGALGLAPTGAAIATKGASMAATAGATSLATTLGAAGAVAGPIGIAVGLVIGLVAGKLFNKQYLNVAAMNTAEGNEIAAFNQYRTIQGQAAGRQFGLDAMRAVWKGALHSGYFPLNHETQCFHQGCSAHPGNASLIDAAIDAGAQWPTFTRAYQGFVAARSKAPATGAPSAGLRRAMPVTGRAVMLRGLGALGQSSGSAAAQPPEAVTFIDHFFIPDNQRMNSLWPIPQQPIEHQILYDVADAYLAQQPITTTPYVASRPYAQPPSPPVAAIPSQPIAPTVVPRFPPTPMPIAAGAGAVTSVGSATQANLDAALAAQGFTRAGTTPQGIPLYGDGQGAVYAYSNGQLYPYGSAAQLAVTGSSGQGIATPVTGLDPQTLQIIASALAQGLTPAQAAQAGANNLQSQGIALTPQIQGQLLAAAQGPAAGTSQGGGLSSLLLGAGALAMLKML